MDGVELELGCVSTFDKCHRLSLSLLGLSQCLVVHWLYSIKVRVVLVAEFKPSPPSSVVLV